MKKCSFCHQSLKLSAQATMHPKCASLNQFRKDHGGLPIFQSTRTECRTTCQRLQEGLVNFPEGDCRVTKEIKGKVIDAGKDRIHPGSKGQRFPWGTRWAVAAVGVNQPH